MTNSNNLSAYPFTAEQFTALSEKDRRAILAVADYLTSRTVEITDESLSEALNLMRVAEGESVPPEEVDTDLLVAIRKKFSAVFQPAIELAEIELRQKGYEKRKHFNFCLVIDPSYEDTTHVAIVDYDKPVCYLHQWSKAWHFSFEDLADLAKTVLEAKTTLVNRVIDLNKNDHFVCCKTATSEK